MKKPNISKKQKKMLNISFESVENFDMLMHHFNELLKTKGKPKPEDIKPIDPLNGVSITNEFADKILHQHRFVPEGSDVYLGDLIKSIQYALNTYGNMPVYVHIPMSDNPDLDDWNNPYFNHFVFSKGTDKEEKAVFVIEADIKDIK